MDILGSFLGLIDRGYFGPRGCSSEEVIHSRLTMLTSLTGMLTGRGAVKSFQRGFVTDRRGSHAQIFFPSRDFLEFKDNQRNQRTSEFPRPHQRGIDHLFSFAQGRPGGGQKSADFQLRSGRPATQTIPGVSENFFRPLNDGWLQKICREIR